MTFRAVAVVTAWVVLGGCAPPQYIEERTPAGTVAPETVPPPAPYRTIRELTKLSGYEVTKTASQKSVAKVLAYGGERTLINIRGATVSPEKVRPGDTVRFRMEYAILAPVGVKAIQVEESWVLEKDGSAVAETEPKVQRREPGGWEARASIKVPGEASPGTYVVKNRVFGKGGRKERAAYFVVE